MTLLRSSACPTQPNRNAGSNHESHTSVENRLFERDCADFTPGRVVPYCPAAISLSACHLGVFVSEYPFPSRK